MSRRPAAAALPLSVVLIDGEHYPPVTARAIAALQAEGERPVAALLVGGSEKLGQVPLEIGVPGTAPAAPRAPPAPPVDPLDAPGAPRGVGPAHPPGLGRPPRGPMAPVALWVPGH